jgi:hypothetical protein
MSGVGSEDCDQTGSSVVKNLIVSTPSEGNYSVKMFCDVRSSLLETEQNVSIFTVSLARSFVSEGHFVLFPGTQA